MATTNVYTWWSAGGGVGKTTLAIIHAAALAEKYPNEVVLLDFKEVTPHIGFIYDLEPLSASKLFDDIERGQLSGRGLIENYLKRKYGIWIMPGIGLEDFRFFTETHFNAIINAAKENFSHIVIDTNDGLFFSGTVAGLKRADEINIVSNLDLTKVSDTKKLTEFLFDQWGVDSDRIQYFINDNQNKDNNKDFDKGFYNGIFPETKFIPYDKEASLVIAGEDPKIPEIMSILLYAGAYIKKRTWLRRAN